MGVLHDCAECLEHRNLRKLLLVRFSSQIGDGMFQAGLATLFFFNPQTLATVGDVASAFAILLLPFTIVGPFAGVLIDRWWRRNVLIGANLVRTFVTLVLAVVISLSPESVTVYVLALVTLGVNRFLLSAFSASLPHTLPSHLLVLANSIIPTIGGIAAGIGAVLGVFVGMTPVAGVTRNSLSLVLAALLFCFAALLAYRFPRDVLGPHRHVELDQAAVVTNQEGARLSLMCDMKGVIGNLVEATKYLIRVKTPAYALGVMAIHRFIYGINFIALILISRNLLTDPSDTADGLAIFTLLAGLSLLGNALAVVLVPILNQKFSPHQLIIIGLLASGASQFVLVFSYRQPLISIAAVLLGCGVQGAKITVDAIVQRNTNDVYRGRAFSIYDMLFNIAFVGAAALAVWLVPDSGWSPVVFIGSIVVHCVMIVGLVRKRSDFPTVE
ncbi:MFS transporter [Arcanobacterium ihumii]|uniref:MFS transporter n=1 Tax=Arcanobacterium ihumii TaxID=2138162 RepID=UPI000F52E765|nr:MFS transporter [Arcanobacterium ihumii]